ncbi:MAG: cytochrome P450 [Sphingomonadaceae bacterium]|nr:cytochrome P450 [Sphingomonadaceae bacterium]
MIEVPVVDPYAPEAMNAPGSYYDALRENCPVAKVDDGDRSFYIVSGYDRVVEVMNNHDRWSKIDGALLQKTEHEIALSQDPPTFTEFRRTYINYLSPAGVKRWADEIRRMASGMLDEILPHGRGDFHDLFAMPLPMRVMALLLGIPQDRLEQYKSWSNTFMRAAFNDPAEAAEAIETLYAFFDEQFDQRRATLRAAGIEEPKPEHVGPVISDDLISVLMTARFQGRLLTNDELRRTTRGFFIGGNETTTSLILNMLVRLNEVPERWERIKAEPAIISNVVEESLRCDPPTIGMFRGAACPVEMDGVTIPENARVIYAIPSANRDPKIFARPTEFLIDRPQSERSRHVAFSFGSHFCPGAWVSRMEARIAFELIVEKMPNLRITGPGVRIAPFNFWGLRSLPVAWD